MTDCAKKIITIVFYFFLAGILCSCDKKEIVGGNANQPKEDVSIISEFFTKKIMFYKTSEEQEFKIKNLNKIYAESLINIDNLSSISKNLCFEYINYLLVSRKERRAKQINYILENNLVSDANNNSSVLSPIIIAAQYGELDVLKRLLSNKTVRKSITLENGLELDLLSLTILSCNETLLQSDYILRSPVNSKLWKKYKKYYQGQVKALCPEYGYLIPD